MLTSPTMEKCIEKSKGVCYNACKLKHETYKHSK